MFQLTEKQQIAHDKIVALSGKSYSRPYVFRIRGYAGTGKTTLLKAVHESLGSFLAAAPTGKAALRISEATGIQAGTIHRWLYVPMKNPVTGALELAKKPLEQMEVPESRLLVIDEASMVDSVIWDDVYDACERLGMNIVLVGDGFQLPPVVIGQETTFNTMDDAFMNDDGVDLTEVMRQALESPIIRASMALRNNDTFGGLMMLPHVGPSELKRKAKEIQDVDGALICHRNKTRHFLNKQVREQLFEDTSVIHPGEPLLVLKNNYDVKPNMFNGEIPTFNQWVFPPNEEVKVSNFYKKINGKVHMGLASIGDYNAEAALVIEDVFGTKEAEILGEEAFSPAARRAYGSKTAFVSANFGYTLTGHKSQGSEWGEVLVVVEPTVRMNTRFGQRWLYTAVTRAKETCNIAIVKDEDLGGVQ